MWLKWHAHLILWAELNYIWKLQNTIYPDIDYQEALCNLKNTRRTLLKDNSWDSEIVYKCVNLRNSLVNSRIIPFMISKQPPDHSMVKGILKRKVIKLPTEIARLVHHSSLILTNRLSSKILHGIENCWCSSSFLTHGINISRTLGRRQIILFRINKELKRPYVTQIQVQSIFVTPNVSQPSEKENNEKHPTVIFKVVIVLRRNRGALTPRWRLSGRFRRPKRLFFQSGGRALWRLTDVLKIMHPTSQVTRARRNKQHK
jgi:hypothetical protein